MISSNFILSVVFVALGLIIGWKSKINADNYMKARRVLYPLLSLISLICLISVLIEFDIFMKLFPIWFMTVSIVISLEIKILMNKYE